MDNTLNGFSSLFGTSRSFIQVNMDECPNRDPSTSCYRPSEDEIYVYPPHAWGEFGIFMVAHEYGHAFHADALWGNEASDSCNGLHHLDTESNLQCAYSEGFADFAGAATRPDLGSYSFRDRIAANDAFPGCAERSSSPPDYPCIGGTSYEGSVIEGAFAAFLYDIVDTAVEPHDSIAAPGSYVRDIVRTCQVKYSGGNYRRANGTDELTFCIENAINPSGYLAVRGATPTNYSESATESGGWTSVRARLNWVWNMYEKPD